MTDGRTPRAKPAATDRAALTEQRRHRAHEELLDIRQKEPAPFLTLEVSNPIRQTRYQVFVPEYPELATMACECTDFGHRGLGTCKHVEAARDWLARQFVDGLATRPANGWPEAERLWKEIDARLSALARDRSLSPIRVRRPGSLLFQGSHGY